MLDADHLCLCSLFELGFMMSFFICIALTVDIEASLNDLLSLVSDVSAKLRSKRSPEHVSVSSESGLGH